MINLLPLLIAPCLVARDAVPNAAEIDALVEAHLKRTGSPSAVVLVQQGSKVIYGHGFGFADVAHSRRPDLHTPYLIASLTKQFTAALICRLVERGKLQLSDPVKQWFTEAPSGWQDITVRHLLTHTSGVTIIDGEDSEPLRPISTAAMRKRILEAPLTAAPGTEFRYSNSGYVLLGMIIEQITKESFAEVLRREILRPLGMRETGILDWNHPPKGLALGFEANPPGTAAEKIDPSWTKSAGAIVSTAADMGKWLAAVQDEHFLPATRTEMFTELKLKGGANRSYGFGWVIRNQGTVKVVSHTGQLPGFSSHDLFTPDGTSIVALANCTQGATNELANQIAERYVPSLVPPRIADSNPTITALARHFVEELLEGRIQRSDLTAQFSQFFTDDQVAQMGTGLKKLGAITTMEPIAFDQKDGLRKFVYRVTLGQTNMTLTVVVNADNKIAAVHIE